MNGAPALRRRALVATAGLAGLAGVTAAATWRRAAAAEAAATAPASGAADRCRELVALARTLVGTAASGTGLATRFRIDVVHYRESLRELMKSDAARPEPQRLPAPLLMEMVRMVALLQAAAECQTGRYIVCPPDLLDRLGRQQRRTDDLAARTLGSKG